MLAALLMGGGQSWPGEQLLALFGLLLIVVALARVQISEVHPDRFRYFWALPAALISVPLLQLIPLPEWVWSQLPGRADLLTSLSMAGADKEGWGTLTLNPLETERLLYTALLPIGIFMAAMTMRGGQRRKVVGMVVLFAGASGLMGLLQLLDETGRRLHFYDITNPFSAVGFFANRNHLASLLLVCIPVTAGLLADRVRHRRRSASDLWVWLGAALLVVLAVCATATGSRAGFLLLMPALLAGGVAFQWSARGGMPKRVASLFGLAVVIATALIVQFTLYAQIDRIAHEDFDEFRADMYVRTLDSAGDTWGVGYGMGSFLHAYDDVGDVAADYSVYVNHAHNDYLELWLEGGLPALALMLAAIVLLIGTMKKKLQPPEGVHDEDTHHRGLQIGAGFGLALLLVHSLVDYPLRTLTLASVAALLAAILAGTVRVTSRN